MSPPPIWRAIELDVPGGNIGSPWYPQQAINESESGTTSSPVYFCTWPDCSSTFRHRFEWVRHEEAVHYCPYHWICCSELSLHNPIQLSHCFICGDPFANAVQHMIREHFTQCTDKPESKRTFLRQDQLAQHIKRAHLKPIGATQAVPKWLLEMWKFDNPQLLGSSPLLRCGFCGEPCSSWTERQEHVSKHLKDGICKFAWWPDRASGPMLLKNE